MNQFVLTKTINARRRRLRIRRVKYTCETTTSHLKEICGDVGFQKTSREISVLLTTAAGGSGSGSGSDKSRNDVVLSGSEVNDDDVVVEGSKLPTMMRRRRLISSCGSVSVIGGRKEMEDAVSVEMGFLAGYDFFGVYDGHGGVRVAEACREMLHKAVAEEMTAAVVGGDGEEMEWGGVMERSFGKVDETVEEYGMMGSTAVVAVVGKDEVVVGNCGDSRAVLCRKGVAVPLSIDHKYYREIFENNEQIGASRFNVAKPDRPDELERVEAAGGRVINWNGPRVLGVLSTSRSIGDQYLKPYIIPTPEVVIHKRSKEDDFLILASDGLWDVITNEVACRVASKCLRGRMRRRGSSPEVVRAAEAAAVLAELAIGQGSTDNISVVVVELNTTRTRSSSSSSSNIGSSTAG
ncbi:Probable protein phosphatase 2C 8 [Linum grandiflorum]